jgi:hypothetical protein
MAAVTAECRSDRVDVTTRPRVSQAMDRSTWAGGYGIRAGIPGLGALAVLSLQRVVFVQDGFPAPW